MSERPYTTLQHNSIYDALPGSITFFGRGPHTDERYNKTVGATFVAFEGMRTGDLNDASRVIYGLNVNEEGGLVVVRLSGSNEVGLFHRGQSDWLKKAETLPLKEEYGVSSTEDVCIRCVVGNFTGILMIPTVLVSNDPTLPRSFRVCIGGQDIHPNNCR